MSDIDESEKKAVFDDSEESCVALKRKVEYTDPSNKKQNNTLTQQVISDISSSITEIKTLIDDISKQFDDDEDEFL